MAVRRDRAAFFFGAEFKAFNRNLRLINRIFGWRAHAVRPYVPFPAYL